MELLIFIAAVVAMFQVFKQKKRLDEIEARLQASDDRLQRIIGDIAVARGVPLSEIDPAAAEAAAEVKTTDEKIVDEPAMPPSVPPVPPDATLAQAPSVAAGPQPSLEERLGTTWSVLAGGGALALGAVLLVKYSIDQGVFGPGVRVALGALLALVLVGLGEWFRRREATFAIGNLPSAHIPSVLTAAGTVAAFATIYAAHALYGFIGSGAAFVLLGLTGIVTMFAAALHGPALAGLGLVGALATPLLVSSAQPQPWPLVIYLAVVAASTNVLARMRKWLWLAAACVAGVVLWGIVMLVDLPSGSDWNLAKIAHAAIQLALGAAVLAVEPHLLSRDDEAETDWIGTAALAALTGLVIATLAVTRFETTGWLMLALAAMAILTAAAYRAAPVATALPLAGLVAVAVALFWPGVQGMPDTRFLWPAAGELFRLPDLQKSYLTFLTLTSLAIYGAGVWRLWTGRTMRQGIAAVYALGAILTPIVVLIVAYLRVTQFDTSIWFAGIAALLAGVYYFVADRFDNVGAENKTAHTYFGLGAFAAAATAAATLAFVFSLDRGYLTVAFAVTAMTTSIFAVVDKIPSLRATVAALGFVVLARLAWDPHIVGASGLGKTPIFNWLLFGYGAPAAAFLGAGYTLKREADDLAARICDALGVLFAFLLVFFQIRHAMHGGDILARSSGHVEVGLFALMCFGGSYVLNRLDLSKGSVIFRTATLIAGVAGAVVSLVGLLVAENPFFSGDRVGGASVFSTLLLAYLLPGAAAAVLARSARGVRPWWYVRGAAIAALALLFAYVTLETRHVFQGEFITLTRSTTSAEMWAYSAVWLALGLAFLGYGIVRHSLEARIASAVLIVLTVVKAVFFDLAGLTGIWRPLSFLVLGVVLIGIGMVYQRLLFAPPTATPPTKPAPPV